MRKSELLQTFLLLSVCVVTLGMSSCPRSLPDQPAFVYGQCTLNWSKDGQPGLYCVYPTTGECFKGLGKDCKIIPIPSEYAKGAQCLMPFDYQQQSAWMDAVLNLAEQRCK